MIEILDIKHEQASEKITSRAMVTDAGQVCRDVIGSFFQIICVKKYFLNC